MGHWEGEILAVREDSGKDPELMVVLDTYVKSPDEEGRIDPPLPRASDRFSLQSPTKLRAF